MSLDSYYFLDSMNLKEPPLVNCNIGASLENQTRQYLSVYLFLHYVIRFDS